MVKRWSNGAGENLKHEKSVWKFEAIIIVNVRSYQGFTNIKLNQRLFLAQ